MLVIEVELLGRARPLTCVTEEHDLAIGDRVLVEQDGRTSFGVCSRVPLDLPWPGTAALPRVARCASEADEDEHSHHQRQCDEWLETARQCIARHNLPMRVLRAEGAPGGRKITFQFVAEGRVDFRELVRDLARQLRARVELRQVGVRDAAVLQGGVGHCGQELCCAGWLNGFAPVSMRMAKSQGLPLNPAKISGQCGRLMCCLRYEIDGSPDGNGEGDDEPALAGASRGNGCGRPNGGCRR